LLTSFVTGQQNKQNNECVWCKSLINEFTQILKEGANIQKFIEEIELIASTPTENYMFNVSSEEALINITGTLGERIFNIEGKSCIHKHVFLSSENRSHLLYSFKSE